MIQYDLESVPELWPEPSASRKGGWVCASS